MDMDELGFFIFMDEMEREDENQEDEDDGEEWRPEKSLSEGR